MADKIASWGDIKEKNSSWVTNTTYPENSCPTKSEILARNSKMNISSRATINGTYTDNQLVASDNISIGGSIIIGALGISKIYGYTGSGIQQGNTYKELWSRSLSGVSNGGSIELSTPSLGWGSVFIVGNCNAVTNPEITVTIDGSSVSTYTGGDTMPGLPYGTDVEDKDKNKIPFGSWYAGMCSTSRGSHEVSISDGTSNFNFTYTIGNSSASGTCNIRITNSSGQTLLSGAHLTVTTGISGGYDTITIPTNLSLNNTVSYKWTGETANISGWINSSTNIGISKIASCSPSRYFSQCNGTMNVTLTNTNAGIVNPDLNPDLGDTDLRPGLDDDIVADN